MEQLEKFLQQLRKAGYSARTNWQQKLNKGYLEHVTVQGNVGYVNVIFQVYGEGNGYSTYIESSGNTFEHDLNALKGIID